MTHRSMVSLAPPGLESDDLLVFELLYHFADHLGPVIIGSPEVTVVVSEQNNISECDLLTASRRELVHPNGCPGLTRYCLPPERIIAYAMVNV